MYNAYILPPYMDGPPSFQEIILEHIKIVLDLPFEKVYELTQDVFETLDRGGKIIFFGNGGSATQASHWAEEFVGRYVKNRKSLPSIALGTNFANLTGIGNDYGFENVFARELESLGTKKDLAIGISTSGNSPNVIRGLEFARKKGIKNWILTGNGNHNKSKKIAEKVLSIESEKTARIQELHALVIHMVFELVDQKYS